jgi:hypothetical protein
VHRISDYWSYSLRRSFDWLTNWLFASGLVTLTLGVLPYVDHGLSNVEQLPAWLAWAVPKEAKDAPPLVGTIAAILAILGLLGNVWGYLQTQSKTKQRIPTAPLVIVASAMLLFGVLLLLFHLIAQNNSQSAEFFGFKVDKWVVLTLALAVFLVFGLFPDVNYVSLHRYYRDRLMETFMPDVGRWFPRRERRTGRSDAGNETLLGRICGANADDESAPKSVAMAPTLARGPYHIINANVVLVSSNNPRYRGRGGDNFILSPLFTGSRATGWEKTDPSQDTGVSLATAMAISGAAISPNAGVGGEGLTRQPVLSVLMGMFNVRMGYWLANPKPAPWESGDAYRKSRFHPNLIYPGFAESFGRNILKEDWPYVLLTDGGHFENLGLYELIRRRLKLILVCDGTADPDYTFSDLANAIEKVRADFGALVEINTADLRPLVPTEDKTGADKRAAMSMSERGYLIATIRYARRQTTEAFDLSARTQGGSEETGLLIYLNTTFFKGLRADSYGYRRQHPSFPDQPTSDQFFNESEFEAYRELGFQTAWQLIRDLRIQAKVENTEVLLFEWLQELTGRRDPADV